MKKLLISVLVILFAAPLSFGHDPRTVAKEFSHTLMVEGSGKLTVTYKSLHWNEPAYMALKKNDTQRQRVLGFLWKKIGTLNADFDVVIGGVQVPKGSYDFGLSFGSADDFSLILGSGGKDTTIPLQTSADGPLVAFLSFDLRPIDPEKPDTFLIEGRGGKFRSSAEVKVPALAPHEHGDKK
jgi:hypothetical protein